MSTDITKIQEQDYNEILLQAVAVIESSRSQIEDDVENNKRLEQDKTND